MRKIGWMGVCALTAALLQAGSAAAQDVPKVEVFGGYTYQRIDRGATLGGSNLNGWNAALTGNVNSWFGVTADFSGHYGAPGGPSQNRHAFLFGPKLTYRASDRFNPFVHTLFGVTRTGRDAFGAVASASESAFTMALGGGLDYKVNNRFAIRLVQADYFMTRFSENSGIVCIQAITTPCPTTQTGTQHNTRVSFGVTWRFGSK